MFCAIDWRISLDGSAQRKESPEIPQRALREIVINAFCHAKYDSSVAFEIDVFKDRVSVCSPGFFPSGFTPEDFVLRHEEPIMLNPKIANVLFKTCEIESFGYGLDRTFKECARENIRYEYENTKSGFRFIFYRPLASKNTKSRLNDTDSSVLEALKENCCLKTGEIADRVGKSVRTVSRSIRKLKLLNFMTRIGDDRHGHWETF